MYTPRCSAYNVKEGRYHEGSPLASRAGTCTINKEGTAHEATRQEYAAQGAVKADEFVERKAPADRGCYYTESSRAAGQAASSTTRIVAVSDKPYGGVANCRL